MTNIMDNFNKQQIAKLTEKKSIPNFRSGDTLKVNIKVIEGDRTRIQAFQGMCIARKNSGVTSSFTVRKISHGEGVERVFPLFSPTVDSIEVLRQGDVKRAKLYYLRKRSGKGARIADKDRGDETDQYIMSKLENEVINSDDNLKETTDENNKNSTNKNDKKFIKTEDKIANVPQDNQKKEISKDEKKIPIGDEPQK